MVIWNRIKRIIIPLCKKNNYSFNTCFILDKKVFSSRLKKILGFRPSDLRIYEMAFIHKSATHTLPDGTQINNERLEFLGDTVLDTVLSEFLFEVYPDANEGELTKIRSRIVNRQMLNKLSLSIGINNLLISHLDKNNPTQNLYGDALEALIGSVFVDRGYSRTKRFIINSIIKNHLDLRKIVTTETDYKSQVFQWAQKLNRQISFNYIEDYDFINKKSLFTTTLKIDHEIFGEGSGTSKKEAEQMASLQAWNKIK